MILINSNGPFATSELFELRDELPLFCSSQRVLNLKTRHLEKPDNAGKMPSLGILAFPQVYSFAHKHAEVSQEPGSDRNVEQFPRYRREIQQKTPRSPARTK